MSSPVKIDSLVCTLFREASARIMCLDVRWFQTLYMFLNASRLHAIFTSPVQTQFVDRTVHFNLHDHPSVRIYDSHCTDEKTETQRDL